MVSPRQLSLGYAAIYGAVGALGPWLGYVLVRQGHDAADIAIWLMLMPATTLFAGPLWSWVADRYHLGTRILQVSTAAGALLAAAMTVPLPAIVLVPVLLTLGISRSGMALMLDVFTLRSLESTGRSPTQYGRIRRWGSVGFVGGAVLAAAVAKLPWIGAPLACAAMFWGIAAVGFARLPRVQAGAPVNVAKALVGLIRQPGMPWLLVSLPIYGIGINAYDTWYAVHMESLGIAPKWTAVAIAAGVSAEVVVLSRAKELFHRVRPPWVVVAAMTVASGRWAVVAWLTDPWLLAATQLLHGLVFGAFWIASVEWLRRMAPIEIRASAQMALPVLGYGVGPIFTGIIARTVVPEHGTAALFWISSVTALVAAALATVAAIQSDRLPPCSEHLEPTQ